MTRRGFSGAVGGVMAAAQQGAEVGRAAESAQRKTLVERLEFFDCDVILGPRLLDAEKAIPEPPLLTADQVLAGMDHYRIQEALLFHSTSKAGADPAGNQYLLKEVRAGAAGRQRLHPCWSIVRPRGGTLPPAEQVIRDLRENGVRAARVFPTNHGYKLTDLRDTLSALEQHRVPLLVDYGITFPHQDLTDWGSVEWVLRNYPALHLILVHPPSRKNAIFFRLMEMSTKLHLSHAGFRIHQELLAVGRLFGAQALIYGSHLPYYTAAAPIAEVIYSGLDEAEQKAVAGDNLRTLLSEVRF
jgi:hypothetical protein